MALTIQNMGQGKLPITTATSMLTELTGSKVPAGKSAIVKNISLVNGDVATQWASIYFRKASAVTTADRLISPKNVSIPPGGMLILDQEITLTEDNQILGVAQTADKIEYVVSGMLRDV